MYEKYLKAKPDDAKAHYFLGSLYGETGDGRALDELKRAISLKPDFAEAHNDLAVVYASVEPARWRLAAYHANKAVTLGYEVEKGFLALIEQHINGNE